MPNYSGQLTPSDIQDVYENSNFTQPLAHTRIFPGDDTPRTFIRCNLKNCDLPPGSTRQGGLHGHEVRDPGNDETITIDGEGVVIEAFVWEKVV